MKELNKYYYNQIPQKIEGEFWGLELQIDLYNCSESFIKDSEYIKNYVIDLCDILKVKRFGDFQIYHFGESEKVSGFSFLQLIETSLISGHLVDQNYSGFINIFSCSNYDIKKALEFTLEKSKALDYRFLINFRGVGKVF